MQITLPSHLRVWINNNRGELSVPRFIVKVLEYHSSSNTPPYLGKGLEHGGQPIYYVGQRNTEDVQSRKSETA